MNTSAFPRRVHYVMLLVWLFVGFVLGGVLLGLAQLLLTPDGSDTSPGFILPIFYALSLLPAIRYAWRKSGRPSLSLTNPIQLNRSTLLAVVAAFLLICLGLDFLVYYMPTSDWVPAAGKDFPIGPASALTIVILAPIMEEVLFRGLLLRSLLGHRGQWAAILISSLLFGLIHFVPAHIFFATGLGLALGYVYVRTRSLALVVLLHLVNNGISYAASMVPGMEYGATSVYVDVALGIVLLAAGVVLLRRTLPINLTANNSVSIQSVASNAPHAINTAA